MGAFVMSWTYLAVETKSESSPSSLSSCSSVRASPVDCRPMTTHLPHLTASLNKKQNQHIFKPKVNRTSYFKYDNTLKLSLPWYNLKSLFFLLFLNRKGTYLSN